MAGPFNNPYCGGLNDLAFDSAGDLYFSCGFEAVVEKLTPSGTLSIVAGVVNPSGNEGNGWPTPGPATQSHLMEPDGIAVDSSGNLYIADPLGNLVEKVTPSGTLAIVAGIPREGYLEPATPGPATQSGLDSPSGVAVDAAGDLFIANSYDNAVEEVN